MGWVSRTLKHTTTARRTLYSLSFYPTCLYCYAKKSTFFCNMLSYVQFFLKIQEKITVQKYFQTVARYLYTCVLFFSFLFALYPHVLTRIFGRVLTLSFHRMNKHFNYSLTSLYHVTPYISERRLDTAEHSRPSK